MRSFMLHICGVREHRNRAVMITALSLAHHRARYSLLLRTTPQSILRRFRFNPNLMRSQMIITHAWPSGSRCRNDGSIGCTLATSHVSTHELRRIHEHAFFVYVVHISSCEWNTRNRTCASTRPFDSAHVMSVHVHKLDELKPIQPRHTLHSKPTHTESKTKKTRSSNRKMSEIHAVHPFRSVGN